MAWTQNYGEGLEMVETTPHHLLSLRFSVFSHPVCCVFTVKRTKRYLIFSLLKTTKKQGIYIKVLRFRLEQLLSFFTDSRSFLHASCTNIQHAHYIPLRTNSNQLKILWARFKSKSKTTLASTTEKTHSWVLETHTAHLHL